MKAQYIKEYTIYLNVPIEFSVKLVRSLRNDRNEKWPSDCVFNFIEVLWLAYKYFLTVKVEMFHLQLKKIAC